MTREEIAKLLANQNAARLRVGTISVTSTRASSAEPTSAEVTLPYPPSVNRIWRNIMVKGRSRTVLSKRGRKFREDAIICAKSVGLRPILSAIEVTLRIYRPRKSGDLDNAAKAVLDSLKGIAFIDDAQVIELHMFRHDDKANPRVEVMIHAVPEETAS